MTDKKKEYPTPPKGIKVMSNGGGYDMKRKKIAHGPGTYAENPHAITKENAQAMRKIGIERTKQAIRDAIVAQTRENGIDVFTPENAIGHAAGVLFDDVLKGKGTLRDRNRVTWDVAKHADLIESHDQTINTQVNTQVNVDLSGLLDILGTTGGQTIDIDVE